MFAGRHPIQEKHSTSVGSVRSASTHRTTVQGGHRHEPASHCQVRDTSDKPVLVERPPALFAHRRLTREAGVTLRLAGTKRLIWGFQIGDHQNFPGPFSNNQKKQKEKGGATIDPTDKAPKNDNKKVPGDKTGT